MRTRFRTALAGVAAMATVVTACAQPLPPERSAIEAGARYVALGSSFASGPGLGPMPSNGCLRSTANYEADVLLVTYPQIAPADGSTCPALVLSADHAAAVAAIGARLNEAFRSAASTTGIRLIDVYAASADHTACASDAWVSGWVDPDDPSGYHAYHPTGAGMRAMAGMVVAAVG